jgi:hypothetical protein
VETLKKLEEVCQPDVRNRNRVDINHSTGDATPTTIESIHIEVENIQLNDNVPDDVRSQFNVARNLALYAWFVYSFNEIAARQALAALEMATRQKIGDDKTALKNLLDKLFPGRQLAPGVDLSKAIATVRNDLAHGSTMMTGRGIAFLRLCAELINKLFQ